jgi:hypothetical protein
MSSTERSTINALLLYSLGMIPHGGLTFPAYSPALDPTADSRDKKGVP